MPVGPGDDILDAIEAGKGDDVLMKDFKLNADQVKSFKSLYYGLSNGKMKYDEIKEYYPELKTYFSGPTLQQTPEAPSVPKEDFTKPAKQRTVAESTARAATVPIKTGLTNQDLLNKKVLTAEIMIPRELEGNDDVVEKMIRNQRYEQAKQQGYDQFATAPRSDMPAANMLADIRNKIDPQTKAQDLPVAPEEIGTLKGEIKQNEPQARQFINQLIINKPEKANDIQSYMYALDANARLQVNPLAGNKVVSNIDALEKGQLKYNAQTRQLVKELPFFQALVAGVKQRTQSLEGYKTLQLPKDQVIKIKEQERAAYDPDQPVEVPKGAGEIGQMFGSEWATLLKGAGITTAASIVGGEAAAPYISAAVNAPEYYKRGFESGFTQTYNELRNQGKSEDEAYEGAMKQARIEAKYDAAEGFVSSFIGGRIGIKELPKFNITGGFKTAVKEVLAKSKHFAAETTVEGLTDGVIAGILQDKKNQAAREAGLFRSDDTIKEAIEGEVTFALAAGAMSQAGRAAVDPNTYKKILYWITKQPEQTTNTKLGEMVLNGDLTQQDADDIQAQIKEQKRVDSKVPEDIKDVSRMAMIDKINKRDELEKQKQTVDEALRGPIEDQIKELNKQILEHSTHKVEQTEEKEAAQTAPESDTSLNIEASTFEQLEVLQDKASSAKANRVKEKYNKQLNDQMEQLPKSAQTTVKEFNNIVDQLKAKNLLTIKCP
jgi:hypothetical protein